MGKICYFMVFMTIIGLSGCAGVPGFSSTTVPSAEKTSISTTSFITPEPVLGPTPNTNESSTATINAPLLITKSTPTESFVSTSTSTTSISPNNIEVTSTSSPPLSAQEKETQIIYLLETNEYCVLPCWWRAVPGKSKWEDIEPLLMSLGASPKSFENSYYNQLELSKQETTITIGLVYSLQGSTINSIYIGTSEQIRNRNVTDGKIYQLGFQNYKLSNIFSAYGLPDEIKIRTYPWSNEGGDTPYIVLIQYNRLGVNIKYNGIINKEKLTSNICLNNSTVDLFLWSPNLSNIDLVSRSQEKFFITPDDATGFRSLSDATGFGINEFIEKYKKPDANSCFSITQSGWLP
ncbi:MAG: hypothetical protein PHQ40_04985 [Anaerolineaceae bacterium]|nr:hypothetical protein [Anaerolineaceae bacterium]